MVSRHAFVTGRGSLDLLRNWNVPATPAAPTGLPVITNQSGDNLTVADPISIADMRTFIGSQYGGTSNVVNTSLRNVTGPDGNPAKAVSQFFQAGTFGMPDQGGTGIALTSAPLPGNYTEATIEFDIRFVGSGQWPLGGKIPGLGGLKPGGTGGVPTGGQPSPDGWSCRTMFRRNNANPTVQAHWRGYVYDPTQPADTYGQDRDTGQYFTWNTWFHVKQYHKMNSIITEGTTGAANGIHRMWFNGTQCWEKTDQIYRLHSTYGINYLVWDNFLGGADASFNAPADLHCQFKNFYVTAA